MKTVFFAALATLLMHSAQARSEDPCKPIIPALPTQIFCASESVHYVIEVNTLMSRPYCTGKNYSQSNKAKIHVYDFVTNQQIATVNLQNGQFTYTLNINTGGTFDSPEYSIHLKNCVSPVFGGVSFSN